MRCSAPCMTLSAFRAGHHPIDDVEGATFTTPGYPAITQIPFLACCAQYPGGSNRCACRLLPCPCCLPRLTGGSHPRLHFRGLLKLHSRCGLPDCLPAYSGRLSRGSNPVSYPTKSLGSYHAHRHLHGWILPPLAICAVAAHC